MYFRSFSAGWQRNVPLLREVEKEPCLHIHPNRARALGIADGDTVRVTSPHGFLLVKAMYYPGIREDTVMLLHGWWQGCAELGLPDLPLLDGGANVNLLYSPDMEKSADPLITAMGSQTLVNVARVCPAEKDAS